VTTHEVFLEVLASVSRVPHLRRLAVETIRSVKAAPERFRIRIVPLSEYRFLRGLDRYARRPDKSYSLVDCISMVVMEEEGITEALTNDHHFEQEGFTILIR
jgi:predicted nucleic acid-binding protein